MNKLSKQRKLARHSWGVRLSLLKYKRFLAPLCGAHELLAVLIPWKGNSHMTEFHCELKHPQKQEVHMWTPLHFHSQCGRLKAHSTFHGRESATIERAVVGDALLVCFHGKPLSKTVLFPVGPPPNGTIAGARVCLHHAPMLNRRWTKTHSVYGKVCAVCTTWL